MLGRRLSRSKLSPGPSATSLHIDLSPDQSLSRAQATPRDNPYLPEESPSPAPSIKPKRLVRLKVGRGGVAQARNASLPDLSLAVPQCESIRKIKEHFRPRPPGSLWPDQDPRSFSQHSLLNVEGSPFPPRPAVSQSSHLSKQMATHALSQEEQQQPPTRNSLLAALAKITSCSSTLLSQAGRSFLEAEGGGGGSGSTLQPGRRVVLHKAKAPF